MRIVFIIILLIVWVFFFWVFVYSMRLVLEAFFIYWGDLVEEFGFDDLGVYRNYGSNFSKEAAYKNYELDLTHELTAAQTDPDLVLNSSEEFMDTVFDSDFTPKDVSFQQLVTLSESNAHFIYTDRLFSFYDYFSNTSWDQGSESGFTYLTVFNSDLILYYFLFIYLIGYWYNYYSWIFGFFVFFVPIVIFVMVFFAAFSFLSFTPKVFNKLSYEDIRESGFVRDSEMLESASLLTGAGDLDTSLHFLSNGDFGRFLSSDPLTFLGEDQLVYPPEFLFHLNTSVSSPYSKYIKDLILASKTGTETLSQLFSEHFLSFVIYNKIDKIWKSNFKLSENPVFNSKLFFPENRHKSLYISASNAAFLDVSNYSYQQSSNQHTFSSTFSELAISRLARFYSRSNTWPWSYSQLGDVYEISQDLDLANKRAVLLLADPFLDALGNVYSNFRSPDDLGLNVGNPHNLFRKWFLRLVWNGYRDTDLRFRIDFIKTITYSEIYGFWTVLMKNNSDLVTELDTLLYEFPVLIEEVLNFIKNPFYCGIRSFLLATYESSFCMFYDFLFSLRFSSVWKSILLSRFGIFLHPIRNNIVSYLGGSGSFFQFTGFNTNFIKFRSRVTSVFYDPLVVLRRDSFWFDYFCRLPYSIRYRFWVVLKRFFKNPFINAKGRNGVRRFGFSFWKYSLKPGFVKLLLSHSFKSELIGLSGNSGLYDVVLNSKDPSWFAFFSRDGVESFSEFSEFLDFNIKLAFIRSVLGSSVNFVYVQSLRGRDFQVLYNKLFAKNSKWFDVISRPGSYQAWDLFFSTVALSDLLKFMDLGEFLCGPSAAGPEYALPFDSSLSGTMAKVSFLKVLVRNIFKSGRSGFSSWQGLKVLAPHDLKNGFNFLSKYVYLVFRPDFLFMFKEVHRLSSEKLYDQALSGSLSEGNDFSLFSKFNLDTRSLSFDKDVVSFSYLKYMYSFLRPFLVYGTYNMAGLKPNYDLMESLVTAESDFPDDDFFPADGFWNIFRSDITSTQPPMGRELEAIEDQDEEMNSFPVYFSLINSSDNLARNILSLLLRFFVKRYSRFSNFFTLTDVKFRKPDQLILYDVNRFLLKNLDFSEYLSGEISVLEVKSLVKVFDTVNSFDESFFIMGRSRFDFIKFLFVRYNLNWKFSLYYFNIFFRQLDFGHVVKSLDLIIDTFYGLADDGLDNSLDIGGRGIRQLAEFEWVDRDETDLEGIGHELVLYEDLLIVAEDEEKWSLDFPEFQTDLGPIEQYSTEGWYSRFQGWLDHSSIFDTATSSSVSAFFPYKQASTVYERGLILKFSIVNRLGFFLFSTYYVKYLISSRFLPLFIYVANFFEWIFSWVVILRMNLNILFLSFGVFSISLIFMYYT